MWKISVDTGGTFTDCIAVDINGNTKRLKVLSSGYIKGQCLQSKGNWFMSDLKWNFSKRIFKGYVLKIDSEEYIVHDFNPEDNSFLLENNPTIKIPFSFTLTACEEAPILASRMVTETLLEEKFPEIKLRLGTTKGTNALLEKNGAKTLLLITKGFKDLLFIGTQQRPHLFQLNIPNPELLHHHTIEINERINKDGNIIYSLNKKEIKSLIKHIKKEKYDSISIALLNSYKNNKHELILEKELIKNNIKNISLSASLHPFIHLLPRAKTTVVNAYLQPILQQYLSRITQYIPSLEIMSSSGGLMDAHTFYSKDILLSGPAGGVLGAAHVAKAFGVSKILTLDMGGTSTDVARYHQGFDYKFHTKIGQQEIAVPTVDIETVAAGGGSICSFDGYKLTVGPESAGASPGPACYESGGPLTITDVNLLLEKMDVSAFSIPIHIAPAKKKLDALIQDIYQQKKIRFSKEEILKGFEKIANEKMTDAIRKISVSKGFDPKEYTLMAYGGAGGLHICAIANLLNIKDIIIPYDAGILSAKGIHEANVEKWVSLQILQPFNEFKLNIKKQINLLKKEAINEFKKGENIIIKNILIYLRLLGQSNTIEIEYNGNLEIKFKEKYIKLFGYYPKNKSIEIESIKIIASTKKDIIKKIKKIQKNELNVINHPSKKYNWDELNAKDCIQGEAILSNALSTVFIPSDWELIVESNKDVTLHKKSNTKIEHKAENETIALELFTNRFMAIAEKTGLQLQRTSFSVNIKERLDFSCAILDPQMKLLANAPHIPVHLGSLGVCARLVLAEYSLEEGDVIITNHPKYGGSHLPDVTLMSGAFDDHGQLIGYLINRAHHSEIGGKRPGSMPPDAKNLAEEGVVIPPTYMIKNGQTNWSIIEDILQNAPYPTRALAENIADINAALASLKAGEEDLKKLVEAHGLKQVHHYMQLLKDSSNATLQEALKPFIGKKLKATEYLDDGHKIQVSIHIEEHQISIDFKGTSDVHPKNLNANPAIVNSVIIYVLRLICDDDRIPLNEGLMQQVDITIPKGSLLSPHFPSDPSLCPAVVGGNTEVSQRLTDTLLKAFGMVACSQGTMNNFLFGNEKFGYYETIGGGTGAGNGFDGRDAVHQHMTNTKITDPEEIEFRYPVRLWNFGIRKKSGGKGKFKGGNGIIRKVEFLSDMDITILSQHRENAPYGLEGGKEGKKGKQTIIRKDGTKEKLQHIDQTPVSKGDRIIIKTPGGGGFGKA
ncbi:MAG: 5-oxoprolinase (ATP-hydrolyzing) [Maribacter sp.]|jgi:5-oxoprolinase (ATP-hydrolysing)